jgi:hypothetical protein
MTEKTPEERIKELEQEVERLRGVLIIVRDKWKDCSDSCLMELSKLAEMALGGSESAKCEHDNGEQWVKSYFPGGTFWKVNNPICPFCLKGSEGGQP